MKKIFISLTLLISLSLVAIVATSMTEAWIDYDSSFGCIGCGHCWDEQTEDAFSQNDDDLLAWWGIYNTGDAFGMHYYVYPDPRHEEDIILMEKECPVQAILYYPYKP